MANRLNGAAPPDSLIRLLAGIVGDAQTLMRQELQLAKAEFRQEWEKTKAAAESMALGTSLLMAAGLLLCFALVHALSAIAPGLPLWACYGIVSVALGLIGGILIGAGRNKASEVNVIPPQTAETLKENAQWLKHRT